jgi:tetratricopeptide (TPR) repeat protein
MTDQKLESSNSPKDALHQAIKLHEAGELTEAILLYERVLETHSETPQIWCLLGVARKQAGDFASAIISLQKAVDLDPIRPDLKAELGIAYAQTGLAEQAFQTLGEVLPKLESLGQDDALVYGAYADACFDLKKWQDAATHYRMTLTKDPKKINAQLNLGVALHHLNRREEAIKAYEAVLGKEPNHPGALTNIGVAYQEQRNFIASLQTLERAANFSPNDPLLLTDLGVTLQKLGRTDDAITRYNEALGADPTYGKAWSNLGNAYQDQLNLSEAWEAHRRAVNIEPENPDFHWNLAMTLLLAGEYEQGWAEYEWRLRRDGSTNLLGTPWQGEELSGKTLFLATEQGAGDAIQFARYAPALAAKGAKVILQVNTSLQKLFETLEGTIHVTTQNDTPPSFDFQASLMSLPYLLHDTFETLGSKIPYLGVPAGVNCSLPPSTGNRRIGLVWAGNPGHSNDHNRSCPFDQLIPLFELPDTDWISLQTEPTADTSAPIIDLSTRLNSFADTAAIMAQLDLIISVDTATAHLAGALGRPVWLMLPYSPDWRWLTDRTDSPWYLSARLYRQPKPGDWHSVINAITNDLN